MPPTYSSYSHALSRPNRRHFCIQVLPYCVFNVCLMILLEYLDKRYAGRYSIETSQEGHSLVTLVVAFLLVSRVNIGLSRYNVARNHLGAMYRESRELIQSACVFSNHTTDQKAAAWRNQVALRSMLLLRLAMAVIDFPCSGVAAWEVPELQSVAAKEIHADLMGSIFVDGSAAVRYGHGSGPRSEWEETMRVPIRMAYLLRKTVHSQSKVLSKEIALSQENAMLASVNGFMGGYYGIRKFITTPTPFPLIQMARLLLFLYLFTVPFILLSDKSSEFAHCFAVFLMTYGFMGLEVVAIELDNPFGDDDNDFDNMYVSCSTV